MPLSCSRSTSMRVASPIARAVHASSPPSGGYGPSATASSWPTLPSTGRRTVAAWKSILGGVSPSAFQGMFRNGYRPISPVPPTFTSSDMRCYSRSPRGSRTEENIMSAGRPWRRWRPRNEPWLFATLRGWSFNTILTFFFATLMSPRSRSAQNIGVLLLRTQGGHILS